MHILQNHLYVSFFFILNTHWQEIKHKKIELV